MDGLFSHIVKESEMDTYRKVEAPEAKPYKTFEVDMFSIEVKFVYHDGEKVCSILSDFNADEYKEPEPGFDYIVVGRGFTPPGINVKNGKQLFLEFLDLGFKRGFIIAEGGTLIIPWHKLIVVHITKTTPNVVKVNWAYKEEMRVDPSDF